VGSKATGEVLSLAYAGARMHQDGGAKMSTPLQRRRRRSSPSTSPGTAGRTSYRGPVKVEEGAYGVKSQVRCDALMIGNGFIEPVTRTLPMEYGVEWSRLIELNMEGSVG
jgi:Fe-S cluster assembly protein SufB